MCLRRILSVERKRRNWNWWKCQVSSHLGKVTVLPSSSTPRYLSRRQRIYVHRTQMFTASSFKNSLEVEIPEMPIWIYKCGSIQCNTVWSQSRKSTHPCYNMDKSWTALSGRSQTLKSKTKHVFDHPTHLKCLGETIRQVGTGKNTCWRWAPYFSTGTLTRSLHW